MLLVISLRSRQQLEPLQIRIRAYLPIFHPIPQFAQMLPHLFNVHEPFVPIVEASKRLDDILFRIQLQKVFSHHSQELGEVDPLTFIGRAGGGVVTGSRGEQRVQQRLAGCLT